MYEVYILKSKKKNTWSYVGSTSDLKRRLTEHNNGKVKSTKGYRPLDIVYTESYKTENQARHREHYLKSGIGQEEKSKIIKYSQVV